MSKGKGSKQKHDDEDGNLTLVTDVNFKALLIEALADPEVRAAIGLGPTSADETPLRKGIWSD